MEIILVILLPFTLEPFGGFSEPPASPPTPIIICKVDKEYNQL